MRLPLLSENVHFAEYCPLLGVGINVSGPAHFPPLQGPCLGHSQAVTWTRALARESKRGPHPFLCVSLLLILDIINDPVRNVSHNEDSEFQISNVSVVSYIQES